MFPVLFLQLAPSPWVALLFVRGPLVLLSEVVDTHSLLGPRGVFTWLCDHLAISNEVQKVKNPGHVHHPNVDLEVELNSFSGSHSAKQCKHLRQPDFLNLHLITCNLHPKSWGFSCSHTGALPRRAFPSNQMYRPDSYYPRGRFAGASERPFLYHWESVFFLCTSTMKLPLSMIASLPWGTTCSANTENERADHFFYTVWINHS